MTTRQEFGSAGHYILADRCRWHRHTHVNGYCISSVGERYENHKIEEIGHGRLYETMVFELDGERVASYSEIHSEAYNDKQEAEAGHEAMVKRMEQA